MRIFTKEDIIRRLQEIKDMGWIESARHGNHGGVGNTLEDLLGIEENNLPIPNASEWELKCHRAGSRSLMTLFHLEPSPRALRFVPAVLLPLYGWAHQTIPNEMSFRQTIQGLSRSDRGFMVAIDRATQKVEISFDAASVAVRHAAWLSDVERRIGLGELNPQPYWGFEDLKNKAGTKLLNCFYVSAKVKKKDGKEYFHFVESLMLRQFSFESFLSGIEEGWVMVDFDARSGHNHGTKFRVRQDRVPDLYEQSEAVA